VIQPVPEPLHALGFDEPKRDGEVDDGERLAGGPEGDVEVVRGPFASRGSPFAY